MSSDSQATHYYVPMPSKYIFVATRSTQASFQNVEMATQTLMNDQQSEITTTEVASQTDSTQFHHSQNDGTKYGVHQIDMSTIQNYRSMEEENHKLQIFLKQTLTDLKHKNRAYRHLEARYLRKNGMLTTINKQYQDLKDQQRKQMRQQQRPQQLSLRQQSQQ